MTKIIVIIFSLLLSLMMSILPFSGRLLELNPSWCLLTLLFWTYGYPRIINVGMAWCIGIITDGLTGSLLGMHAFSFVITVFLFDLFCRRFHMFHILQQSLVMGVLVAFNSILLLSLEHLLTDNMTDWTVMLSAVTSVLCWPFYRFFGQKFHLIRG